MPKQSGFPWVALSAVVAVATLASVTWLQLPEIEPRQAGVGASMPPLGLRQLDPSSANELLAEKLAAYDPSPLFIPSTITSNETALLDETRSVSSSPFDALPPELTKTAAMRFPAPVPIPKNTVDGLRLTERSEAPLVLARADAEIKPLEARAGRVEVVDMASGIIVSVFDLPSGSVALPQGDWQPLEMIAAVSRSGLAGDLVIITSSGSGEIDEFFGSHLNRKVRLGERLREGFYAFRVGP